MSDTESKPIKRGRGRPPKAKPDNVEKGSSVNETYIVEVSPAVKTRKIDSAMDTEEVSPAMDTEDVSPAVESPVVVKRSRGRPPKHKVVTQMETMDKVENEEEEKPGDKEKSEVIKRGRGRPPKASKGV